MTTRSKRSTAKSAAKRTAPKRSVGSDRAPAKKTTAPAAAAKTAASKTGIAKGAASKQRTGAAGARTAAAGPARKQSSGRRIAVTGDSGHIRFSMDRALEDMDAPHRDAIVKTVQRVSDSLVRNVDPGLDVGYFEVVQAATRHTAEVMLKALREAHDELRKRVETSRVEPIERAAKTVIGRLVHDAYSQDVTDTQLSDRAQLAIDAFNVVLSGDRKQLESVIDALDVSTIDTDEAVDLEQARARARIRMQAIFRKVLSESLTLSDLKPYFKSRQRLQQLRDEDRVFALKTPYERSLVYPAWQFDSSYEPLAVMPELITTAKEAGLTPLAFHQVMTGRRAGGKSGVELLAEGREDLVLGLIRATDRGGAPENAEGSFNNPALRCKNEV
jgi:hypothetical protein